MLSNYIFMLLHGSNGDAASMDSIAQLIKNNYEEPVVLQPTLTTGFLSCRKTGDIVNMLLTDMDVCWAEKTAGLKEGLLPTIVLIGYSMGALFARKLYVCACGENGDVPLEKNIQAKSPRAWAARVDRVILLAGMNNGWKLNFHLDIKKSLVMLLAGPVQSLFGLFGKKPVIFHIRRGGTFITQLRLQSIKMQNVAQQKGVGDAMIVQLLGTLDDLVSPDDNIDLVAGNNFVYLEMPYSGHGNVIRMNDTTEIIANGKIRKIGDLRAERLLESLLKSREALKGLEIVTAESTLIKPDESVTDVVFVIHGIRDEGYWTKKLAQRVVKAARDIERENGQVTTVKKFETETSSYGYFPLLYFALPTTRRAKVEWLMEQYSENMAKYPRAEFSYVGHSNGTYVLAKALEEYPACKFKHVLFAGSVISRTYDWGKLMQSNRVKNICNIAASSDLVVGVFPQAFITSASRFWGLRVTGDLLQI